MPTTDSNLAELSPKGVAQHASAHRWLQIEAKERNRFAYLPGNARSARNHWHHEGP